MARGLLNKLNTVATTILLIFGIISLPITLVQLTGSWVVCTIVGFGIFVILGYQVLAHLLAPSVYKHFGLPRCSSDSILAYDQEEVTIDGSFRATVTSKKTLIFPTPPTEDDLIDIIDLLPHETLDETIYRSSDSSMRA